MTKLPDCGVVGRCKSKRGDREKEPDRQSKQKDKHLFKEGIKKRGRGTDTELKSNPGVKFRERKKKNILIHPSVPTEGR